MTEDHRYRLLFENFMRATMDAFIVIDCSGIITDINQNYCDFLGKTKEETIGRPIHEIIKNTKMYETLQTRQRRDDPNGVHIHNFSTDSNSLNIDTSVVNNRFCIFDEEDNVVGAACQIHFKERIAAITYGLLEQEFSYLHSVDESSPHKDLDRILGLSPQVEGLKQKVKKVADRDFPVLITGETGTGKELFAKALHAESSRSDKPIISINCAAIPADLLESELFGYEGGAFTGARKGGKIGKFELANGGTIFLDEIGDMALPLQAKLLRVLQEQEIEKVGGTLPIPIDVRIIAATRQDLLKMIRDGMFREDLYYRLSVINLEIPPLRERPEDILLYANSALNQLNRQYKTEIMMSDSVKRRLREYSWPGNVRELINVITSAYASCDMLTIDETDLPLKHLLHSGSGSIPQLHLPDLMDEYEATLIRDALRRNNHSCSKAAVELGIDRSLLYKKMKRLGISLQRVLSTPKQ